MAKLRPRQLEPGKTVGPSKLGFDGEKDGWVLVKKQRVIIVLPPLPLPQHFTVDKPAETSQLQASLEDGLVDTHETSPIHTVVPSLLVTEHCGLQKPVTSQPQAELRDGVVDTHETTIVHVVVPSLPVPKATSTTQSQAELRADEHETTNLVHTMVPSLPLPEHCALQKPVASQPQAELSDFIAEMEESTFVHCVVPSLPVPEHCILQKPATSQSQAELREDTHETDLRHTLVPSLLVTEDFALKKPATSQSQDVLRADTYETTLVHTMVPSLPATLEHCTLQKPATSQSQGELRDFVADTHETSLVHAVEPKDCPDFTSVDKPEIVMDRNLTTRKASAPRRQLQDRRMGPSDRRRKEIHRSSMGHKPFRFPRVMCSSVVMDNEKLRVVNLERKVERAGGLNEWVGSIGLGREFERMLRGQRMSKFQVANLTMEKLKHMGALAVGPRRKLIHAIRCVYHPHCLRASFN